MLDAALSYPMGISTPIYVEQVGLIEFAGLCSSCRLLISHLPRVHVDKTVL